MTMNCSAAKVALSHLDIEQSEKAVKAKSRDFFWYSPVLKSRLDHVKADFVVTPKSELEIIEVLKVCYQHNVPVTTRGAGTGNYGQAIPLEGGCIMHLIGMHNVKEVYPGRVICEPGVLLKDLDAHCIRHSQQEIRMFSSTWATATIGGFIAGGSGGVGSCTWGSLRDLGNIIRLRVITMEEIPRVIEFRGEELARVSHGYGTNGIISEIEIPLAPAYDWTEMFIAFDEFEPAMDFAENISNEDGILIKLATVFEAPISYDYFQRVKPYVNEGTHLVALIVAPHSMDGFDTFIGRRPEARVIYRSDDNNWERNPGRVFEYGWNHTTLRALKVDPSITYLQVRYGYPEHCQLVNKMRNEFYPEVLQHLETIRENGKIWFAGLSLVKFTTEERLNEIIQIHEDAGAIVFNPHRYTLEEGGRQTIDDRQLQFKKEADPKGLLNPGKMISWDDPSWDYSRMYDYPKLQRVSS
ncbi:MAG: FAD-binding oxidoreductase [Aestuariivita sp.]|nr:FAD-binding oxidoreductase [Aestuariivita sp.]